MTPSPLADVGRRAPLTRALDRRLRDIGPLAAGDLTRPAVVIAPHFDDETLGCGGTIARKIDAGAPVKVVHLSDGTGSHRHLVDPATLRARRENEAVAAATALGLGIDDLSFLDLPDGALGANTTTAFEAVMNVARSIGAMEIFVPHRGDRHPDHVATTEIGRSVAGSVDGSAELIEYPIWHWQQFPWVRLANPLRRSSWSPTALHGDAWRRSVDGWFGARFVSSVNRAVDIRETVEQKRAALACYETQLERQSGSADWATLGDVSDGDFLACFTGDLEFFRVTAKAHP